jgi:hypothetical protein
MRVVWCSDSEMSPAEIRAMMCLQRTGRLRFETSEAEARDQVRELADTFAFAPERDVYLWILVRRNLERLDPRFACMSFQQAVEGLGNRRKPSALGTAARWSCMIGAFGESDFPTAKDNFRDAMRRDRPR